MRFLKGHRTRIFALVVGILGIVELYEKQVIESLVPADYQGLVLMAIGVGIFVLRQMTTTPPGEKY